jgi:hypothetical protein
MECIGLRSFILSPPFVPWIKPEGQALRKIFIQRLSKNGARHNDPVMLSLTQHLFGYLALGSKEWLKVESYERFVVQFFKAGSLRTGFFLFFSF